MKRKRAIKASFAVLLLCAVVVAAGCPKDPYRAAIQGSADVSNAVSSAVKLTASYYSTGKLSDQKKASVAGVLNTITDCNMTFRKSVVDTHNSGAVGAAAYLPIADSFVRCAQMSPQVLADPTASNILKAVDTAIQGVSVAIASAKGTK